MTPDMQRELERRVLLVAPTRRDGEITQSLLQTSGLTSHVCQSLGELAKEVRIGAAAILMTEDALISPEIHLFLEVMTQQPSWSDLAVVLLMKGGSPSSNGKLVLQTLTNMTLLERPAPTRSVVSAVQAAARGRERQYQIRDQMEAIRRAEAVSSELRRQLEIAVEASELGTFHCEIPLNALVWNEQCKAHFWLPPDAEANIDLFYAILHPDDRERTRQAVEACIREGRKYDVEYRTVSPQGEIRWIRATGRTYYDQDQRPVRFDGTTQDVTQRKRAEEALHDANRRKDEFLATLAHELRNPLAPIRNSLHLLRLADDLSPTLVMVRDIMERQVNQMVRLIDDLLDVSRISRGKIELRKETIELATIVSTAVESIKPLLDSSRQQLAISLPAKPILLDADPVRLAQIISNLLNNASKYTLEGGQIWLTAHQAGDQAIISVQDTGMGISAEMLPRVFDMFAQVENSISRSQGGLGIGLSLTKSFVEMHGGRIVAESAGLNQGSRFVVSLPISSHPPHAVSSSDVSISTSEPSPLPRRRILVVDDARAARYILGKLLETMGQEVHTAGDGLQAIDLAHKLRPDLVISDIAMPEMDGYELATRLRKSPQMEGMRLVALTGYGQDSDKQRAKEAGFDYHLVKPVSFEALEALLKSLPPVAQSRNSGSHEERIQQQ